MACALGGGPARAQVSVVAPTAAPLPVIAGETDEQHGRRLLDAMVAALGGSAWLNRGTVYQEGQTAVFFRNQPTGVVTRFVRWTKLPTGSQPELTRDDFLTVKGMIQPGMKRDVAHIWTADNGFELTYKGVTPLPKAQVEDYLRRRAHSIDVVVKQWLLEPGVVIVSEGTGMRDRLPIDKVTVLTAHNDAVTLELSQETHLPVERLFEWRNEQFKDHDVDEEVFGDWRIIGGIATPMNMERYRNGDMVEQTFYTKVRFGEPIAADLFDPDVKLKKF